MVKYFKISLLCQTHRFSADETFVHPQNHYFTFTCPMVKSILRDQTCLKRPHIHGRSISQYNLICHQTPSVLKDHIFMASWVVFQDGFYCITKIEHLEMSNNTCMPTRHNAS